MTKHISPEHYEQLLRTMEPVPVPRTAATDRIAAVVARVQRDARIRELTEAINNAFKRA